MVSLMHFGKSLGGMKAYWVIEHCTTTTTSEEFDRLFGEGLTIVI